MSWASLREGLRTLSGATAALAMMVGALVLLGWVLDARALTSLSPAWVSMKVNAAIGFLVGGLSLWLLRDEQAPRTRLRRGRACAAIVALIGTLTLTEYALEKDFGIDQLMVEETAGAVDTSHPGRMSPVSALCFVLVGLSLLGLDWRSRRGQRLAQALWPLPALLGLTSLAGYLFGVEALYVLPLAAVTAMAVHTSVLFIALAVGVAFARRGEGPLGFLTADGIGSAMARWLLPIAVSLPFVLAWLRVRAEHAGFLSQAAGATLLALSQAILLVGLIWSSSLFLNSAEAGRVRASAAMQQLLTDLDLRVDERTAELLTANNALADDVTRRKLAEQQIQQLNAELRSRATQLEEANRELEAFSYSVSHDLRAPLRHILGYVEMLTASLTGRLSEKEQRYLKTVTEAGSEMGQLIDDLLSFSKMARAEISESPVDMDTLVRRAVRGLEVAAKGRNIVWTIAPLPLAFGDAAMLLQVLGNLLGNAVKYTRPRDPARIEIGCDGDETGRTIFFVRDNGVGFDMKYAHKLFAIFQRLHGAQEFEGTGVGLATVQRIMARHGERAWAHSAVGEGATFCFTLKTATGPLPEPKVETP